MAREKKKYVILPADDSFDMTFIALMLLLLCFMVIMVSMAQLDDPRFREAIGSVKGALSFLTHAESKSLALDGSDGVLTQRAEKKEEAVASLKAAVDAQFGDDAAHLVQVEVTDDGALISLGAVLLFESGSAGLQDRASPVLDEVASIIVDWNGSAEIRGHTDDLPMAAGGAYPSNWELSLVRAASVVRYLERRGVDGSKLYAAGMGSAQPAVPNRTAAHRYLNRRVEIDIVAED